MTELTSRLPDAGWYTDPSDGAGERWWSGDEWTEHSRRPDAAAHAAPPAPVVPRAPIAALVAPRHGAHVAIVEPEPEPELPPAPEPAVEHAAAVTTEGHVEHGLPEPEPARVTGDIPQFAVTTDGDIPQFESQINKNVPELATSGGFASFGAMLGVSTPVSPAPAVSTQPAPVSPTWATAPASPAVSSPPPRVWDPAKPPAAASAPPKNTIAIVGFVLSLFGFGLVSLILSIIGLRRARLLPLAGHPPIGRARAKWGIGLSILSLVSYGTLSVLIGVLGFTFLQDPTAVNVEIYEAQIAAEIEKGTGEAPRSVECPSDTTFEPSTSHDCTIILADGTGMLFRVTIDENGDATSKQII